MNAHFSATVKNVIGDINVIKYLDNAFGLCTLVLNSYDEDFTIL